MPLYATTNMPSPANTAQHLDSIAAIVNDDIITSSELNRAISLAKYNISIEGEIFDTTLAHYLINPDINHSTKIISENYLNYSIINGENKINNLSDKTNIIFQLKGLLEKELKQNEHISLYKEIEIPC